MGLSQMRCTLSAVQLERFPGLGVGVRAHERVGEDTGGHVEAEREMGSAGDGRHAHRGPGGQVPLGVPASPELEQTRGRQPGPAVPTAQVGVGRVGACQAGRGGVLEVVWPRLFGRMRPRALGASVAVALSDPVPAVAAALTATACMSEVAGRAISARARGRPELAFERLGWSLRPEWMVPAAVAVTADQVRSSMKKLTRTTASAAASGPVPALLSLVQWMWNVAAGSVPTKHRT